MRLAKRMLYVCRTSDGVRRVFLLEEKSSYSFSEYDKMKKETHITYQCHYYSGLTFNTEKNQYSTSNYSSHYSSEQSKLYIEDNYKYYLKIVNDLFLTVSTINNCLFLIGLRSNITEDGIR